MNKANLKTRYRLEKRIKALEAELRITKDDLYVYRNLSKEVYAGLAEVAGKGGQISMGWILGKYRAVFR